MEGAWPHTCYQIAKPTHRTVRTQDFPDFWVLGGLWTNRTFTGCLPVRIGRGRRRVIDELPTTREVSHRGSNLVLGPPTASCGQIALICRGSCSLPAAFHQKHMEIRGQRLSVELPHHQCDLTSMVGGMVRQMLHQVRETDLRGANGKRPASCALKVVDRLV